MRRIVPSALAVKAGLIYRANVDRAHLIVIDDPGGARGGCTLSLDRD